MTNTRTKPSHGRLAELFSSALPAVARNAADISTSTTSKTYIYKCMYLDKSRNMFEVDMWTEVCNVTAHYIRYEVKHKQGLSD